MRLRIKELRKSRGWSGEHLAELIGSSKSYLSEIENGKKFPSGRLLKALSRELGVPVHSLIIDDETGVDLLAHLEVMKGLGEGDQKAVIRHALGLLEQESQSSSTPTADPSD